MLENNYNKYNSNNNDRYNSNNNNKYNNNNSNIDNNNMEDKLKRENTSCNLCPRACNVDRTYGQTGFCGMTDKVFVARASLHMWEESCISGKSGSGAIFFSGCTLRCVFCQNYNISTLKQGKEISIPRLAEIMIELRDKGANNINLVTPSHYVNQIIQAIEIAKEKGLNIPIVYNSSAYENPEIIEKLNGYVDIFLPDFKYMSFELSKKYSRAEDYPIVAKNVIKKMFEIAGKPEFNDKNGEEIMKSGVIVRHLVLPGYTKDSKEIIKYLYETYGDSIYLSIMNQYTPLPHIKDFPELDRKVTKREYNSVVDYALEIGVTNGFIQEGKTASESFIPNFNFEGLL